MNPNDPFIQADWAWMQACLGNPERALAASDIATKLNPRYPTWYNYYRARILFQLERYADAAVTFEQQTLEHPERHPRDMAWRAAAYGHLGRIEEAKACAEVFISSLRCLWRGDPGAQPKQYVDWLIDVSYLRQPDDVARLRDGCASLACLREDWCYGRSTLFRALQLRLGVLVSGYPVGSEFNRKNCFRCVDNKPRADSDLKGHAVDHGFDDHAIMREVPDRVGTQQSS